MKKIIGLVAFLCLFTACDDKLDIVPKGKTTLDNVTDLELLLNQEYSLGVLPMSDLGIICNESLGMSTFVSEMLSLKNTLNYAYIAYDETVDRAVLSQTDSRYSSIYKYINYMNVIIDKIGEAKGDEARKPRLIAEARVIRAYLHWLLVNIYAKQYDAATAGTEGGIAYVDEVDVSKTKVKLTIEETYARILDDCSDEVIGMLPVDDSGEVFRADNAFGNAVRAKVLMQMKRYEEALPYALEALRINSRIEDRSTIVSTMSWSLSQTIANNYVYMGAGIRVAPTMETLSCESCLLFEPGDYVVNYDLMGGWSEEFGMMFAGIGGCRIYFGWSACMNVYGICSDRMYYVAAECYIRAGEIRKGLELVDRVRVKRVENCPLFVDAYDAGGVGEEEAMAMMQKAKWIECVSTYENFFDCKRWNTEDKYKRTITRSLGEYGTYSIAPESSLWVLPFPADAVRYNPTLTQNYQ